MCYHFNCLICYSYFLQMFVPITEKKMYYKELPISLLIYKTLNSPFLTIIYLPIYLPPKQP